MMCEEKKSTPVPLAFDLSITFDNPISNAGTGTVAFDNTINGDYAPMNYGTATYPIYKYDSLGNTILDPSKPAPDSADQLNGSAGNDVLVDVLMRQRCRSCVVNDYRWRAAA